MPSIFINYRRADSAGAAAKLKAELVQLLPGSSIYLDASDNQGGENYRQRINGAIDGCHVFICLIGRNWLDNGPNGRPRLFEPGDVVFEEIDLALDKGKDVLPLLVNGAEMPLQIKLPEAIKRLSLQHAMKLSEARVGSDAQRIAKRIRTLVAGKSRLVQVRDRIARVLVTPALVSGVFAAGALGAVNFPQLGLIKALDLRGEWSKTLTAEQKMEIAEDYKKQRDDALKVIEKLQSELNLIRAEQAGSKPTGSGSPLAKPRECKYFFFGCS